MEQRQQVTLGLVDPWCPDLQHVGGHGPVGDLDARGGAGGAGRVLQVGDGVEVVFGPTTGGVQPEPTDPGPRRPRSPWGAAWQAGAK